MTTKSRAIVRLLNAQADMAENWSEASKEAQQILWQDLHRAGRVLADIIDKEPKGVTIHVTLLNGSQRWYPVPPEHGWKIDTTDRCLIIGKDLGRVYIPLDNIDCFSPERAG